MNKKYITIYGVRPLIEAIKAKKITRKIFFQKEIKKKSSIYVKLINISKKNNIPIQYISKKNFFPLKNKNHQGVYSIINPIKTFRVKNLLSIKKKNPIIIILDRITDIRNFGSIVRTASFSGVDFILIPDKNTALIGPDSIKTSSGTLFNIPICKEKNIEKSIKYMIDCGVRIISATEKAKEFLYNINFLGPVAIILGNEETGISHKYLNISYKTAKIPFFQKKRINSLNVSVACGVFLYEIYRQRNLKFSRELF